MKTRYLQIPLLLIWLMPVAAGDEADRAAVMHVIDTFFAGMTAKDTASMQKVMTRDGVLYGYRDDPDNPEVFSITHADYLENLAGREGTPVERIWNPEIDIRDRIATVWTPYDFHSDGVFSHCGANRISLLKGDHGWIITGIVFSVRIANCTESPLGPLE